jgi:hypothetical protein
VGVRGGGGVHMRWLQAADSMGGQVDILHEII